MRYPQVLLAAGLAGLSLLAAAPARTQVAETVHVSLTEPAGGGGPVARRPTPPVLAVFALHATAGREASDHRFHKVRGELLIRNASVFRVAKPLETVVGEPFIRTLPHRDYEGVALIEAGVDESRLLDGAPERDAGAFRVR